MAGKFIMAIGATLLAASAFAAQNDYVKIQIKGQLHNDLRERRATIAANGFIYELDFGGSKTLHQFAEGHDRDTVLVEGFLRVQEADKAGALRLIVVADRLEAGGGQAVRFDPEPDVRPYEERPIVRERTIIREKHKDPFFKVGPLEIGN